MENRYSRETQSGNIAIHEGDDLSHAVVYHWWSLDGDAQWYKNIRIPLLGSIASLRAVNKTIPIYVLDGSETEQDWSRYADRLNISVVKNPFQLREYSHRDGWRNLSRMFDLALFDLQIPEQNIIYCDADLFWLRDPLPLDSDLSRFCFNGYNSGFFYYDKKSAIVTKVFDLFQAYTITALNDENFRIITRQYTRGIPFFVIDEQILTYLAIKMPELFNMVTPTEHFALSNHGMVEMVDDPKTLHMHAVMVENPLETVSWKRPWNRGITAILIRELFSALESLFSPQELEELYGKELLEYVSPIRRSIADKDFQQQLLATKDSDGFYHLIKSCPHL